jgi:hypothetical protein
MNGAKPASSGHSDFIIILLGIPFQIYTVAA